MKPIQLAILAACILGLFTCKMEGSYEEKKDTSNLPKVYEDPLAPKTSKADALTARLHTATISTTSLDSIRLFYVEAMGMELEGPFMVSEETRKLQGALWGIPDGIGWEQYLLTRPATPDIIQIRVLVLDTETPHIHQSWDSRELGPFSLGFPNMNQAKLDKTLRNLGFTSMAPMQEGKIPRPDGTSYRYIETIYKAPDFVHAVGIERKDGMPQLAPVDSATEKGGPGYSAQILQDSDLFMHFLTEVLGLELRSDRNWKTSPGSALGVPSGLGFRFALVYGMGESFGHLLFVDYEDDKQFIPLKVKPKVPNRGLGMWTFQTKDIEEVRKRALANGIEILHDPIHYASPDLGEASVMTILAPNGFLVELFTN